MATEEGKIEKQILVWLMWKGILAWKVKTMGTYDQRLGRYRKSSPLYRKGVSDIHGIYRGKPFAIECKSKKGVLSVEQKLFIQDYERHGGIAIVARSVEDVERALKLYDVKVGA